MSLVINIYYTGQNGNAKKFVEEMTTSGLVNLIRQEEGNEKYEYYFSKDNPETVLLIDVWSGEDALNKHHKSDLMKKIAELRDKYKLHMKVEQFVRKSEFKN